MTINDWLWEHLADCVDYGVPVKMAMEGYSFGSKLNRELLGELGGLVKMIWFLNTGQDPEIIAPTALKLAIAGKGNASKEDMLAAVQKFDPEVVNHNVADAYGLAYMIYSA